MTGPTEASLLTRGLAALLRGEVVRWRQFRATPAEFLEICSDEDLAGLVYRRVCKLSADCDWPAHVCDELAGEARSEAARELLRREEIIRVLGALAAEGVHPVLLKGAPLAYLVYDTPHLRPRRDTDLLVPRAQIDAVRGIVTRLGYASPAYCDGELLFGQFELAQRDRFGVEHAFDFHWKISTQSMFADVLTYDEVSADSIRVPDLGPHARTASFRHALLLACLHPVMHHRNAERLIWIHDIHLLASRLSAAEVDGLADLAVAKQVAAITARALSLARTHFRTDIPENVTMKLATAGEAEPSAAYLQPNRRWHHELVSSLRALSRWSDRARLLREVLLPDTNYVLKAYGLAPGSWGTMLLPALYVHRGAWGLVKVLTGRK